ncbi:MAG: arylsulfate sulfotransferase [Sulfurimonas sp.]|jgi:arylsulfate sulfotransferase
MKIRKSLITVAVFASMVILGNTALMASGAGAASGGVYSVPEESQGQLGAVTTNPYGMAPQTAVINLNGKSIKDVEVTIEPKKDGTTLTYKVPQEAVQTHEGIPVFGLYADYDNKIHVSYTMNGKKVKETYKLYINPEISYEGEYRTKNTNQYEVTKSSKEFKDRLYFVNKNYIEFKPDTDWKRVGGALGFAYPGITEIIDATGDIRWHFACTKLFQNDGRNLDKLGFAASFKQLKNGDVLFIQGQRYMRYDIMGREVFNRRLPRGYIDTMHEIIERPNGDLLLRVGKRNYLAPDGKMVNTLKDHIIEVDSTGRLVHTWDLAKSLDAYRDVLLKALDPRAVCLEVDEHAKKQEVKEGSPFGDVVGVGSGRNWAHTNSIYYDESDDTIVVSLRHQGVAKIDKNDEVKWILAPNVGWKKSLQSKVLTPVDKNGKKLDCEGAVCKNTDFDWSFTQHTAYLNPELGKGYLTMFDNGDGRGYEQPAFVTDKYSRAVAYKIDEEKMTVQQLWEYGKDRGFGWFSMVTGNVNYDADTKSFHTATLNVNLMKFHEPTWGFIDEIKLDKNNKPYLANEIKINFTGSKTFGYRSGIVKKDLLFGK